MTEQADLSFEGNPREEGHARWLAGRSLGRQAMAVKLNLPLGHKVEIWLIGNIRLQGMLRLKEDLLFIEEKDVASLELVVEKVPFRLAEIESCVRLD